MFNGQLGADSSPAKDQANIVKATKRGRLPLAKGINHLGDEGEFAANLGSIGPRFNLPGQFLAERTGGVTGKEIANLAGVSRPRCNKALKQLEQLGILKLEYGGLTVLDLDGLRRLASA